jgi:DNA polymerase (family X)
MRSFGLNTSATYSGVDQCQQTTIPCNKDCPSGLFELVKQSSVCGVLHSHTSLSGGPHSIYKMAETAMAVGLEYIGVTDKNLTPNQVIDQSSEISEINKLQQNFQILHGIELEADSNGNLPFPDEVISLCDFVAVTLKENFLLTQKEATERAIKATMNPFTSVLSHPVGDLMTSDSELIDMELVLMAAAHAKVAVEIDANPSHAGLNWHNCQLAQQLGVKLVIASDAHRAARLLDYRHGAEMIRSAGICCRNILNSWSADELKSYFGNRALPFSSTDA